MSQTSAETPITKKAIAETHIATRAVAYGTTLQGDLVDKAYLAWLMFGGPQKPLLNEDDVRDYLNQVPEWLEPLKNDDPRPH